MEIQVRILSCLRAVDLSAVHQTNRYFWQNARLQHAIVVHCAEQVYPPNLTKGFAAQPISTSSSTTTAAAAADSKDAAAITSINSIASGKGKSSKNHQGRRGKSRSNSLGSQEEDDSSRQRRPAGKNRSCSMGSLEDKTETSESSTSSEAASVSASPELYTFEHLRNMELLVVARVLNSPEPTTGFVVSKSWCKTALRWLEGQQERLQQHQQQQQEDAGTPGSNKKKKKTKKQRLKERRQNHVNSSSASARNAILPPPPNVNSDITCEHDQLQHYTSTRSARARRRLLDKQAWKILKALYPESTPLPASTGECLQCRAEACQAQKQLQDEQEMAKQQRKVPLKDPCVRRFYTRTRGVPEHCLRRRASSEQSLRSVEEPTTTLPAMPTDDGIDVAAEEDMDRKMPASKTPPTSCCEGLDDSLNCSATSSIDICPFVDGTYYVLPRVWCHGWRRFMKTGEGGFSPTKYAPPDAACLLCDSHRMALLPPHLEAFLSGESSQLLEAATIPDVASLPPSSSRRTISSLPPGQAPTEAVQAMRSLGLSEAEISQQLTAMRSIEAQQQQRLQRQASANNNVADGVAAADAESSSTTVSRNERLDRENHAVVEILTQDEFSALEACWPGTALFALRFSIERPSGGGKQGVENTGDDDDVDSFVHRGIKFCTPICHSCDATGRQCSVSIKNRARGWVKKGAEKSRSPASLEY